MSAIRALLDCRLEISAGVDDAVLEAIGVGATGWIAGLANALPRESVELFHRRIRERVKRHSSCTAGFCPCSVWIRCPTLFSSSNWCKQEVGMGNPRVRPPRLELVGSELAQATKIICDALCPARNR